MAWITPVTNRRDASTQTTCEDFNRICGNFNYKFATSLKEDWTVNDIVDELTWKTICETLAEIDSKITDSTRYDNFNRIEKAIDEAEITVNIFPADGLYPSNTLYPK